MGCFRERWMCPSSGKSKTMCPPTKKPRSLSKTRLTTKGVPSVLVGRKLAGEESGVCGAYLVRRPAETVSKSKTSYVFKPKNEEAEKGMKHGVVFGDAAAKEAAVYQMDHHRWAGVPFTTTGKVELRLDQHPNSSKFNSVVGSLQKFVPHDCSSENVGSKCFSVDEVHRIGLLDCRIFNLDRHEGNILVCRSESTAGEQGHVRLIPIDHGFSLPSWNDLSDAYFCWHSWSQASEPFSEETKKYVESLTPFDDIYTLRDMGIRPESIITYLLCSLAVKYGISAGLTLRDLGNIFQRDLSTDEPSPLEVIVSNCAAITDFHNFKASTFTEFWNSAKLRSFFITYVRHLLQFIRSTSAKH